MHAYSTIKDTFMAYHKVKTEFNGTKRGSWRTGDQHNKKQTSKVRRMLDKMLSRIGEQSRL